MVISLNQAGCCEAEAPRFLRLMLGDTLGIADHYAPGDHEAATGLAGQTCFSLERIAWQLLQ